MRPPKRIVDPPLEPVDADAMAAEVARLRTPVAEADRPSTKPEAPEEQSPEPVSATPVEEPVSATPVEESVSETPAEAPKYPPQLLRPPTLPSRCKSPLKPRSRLWAFRALPSMKSMISLLACGASKR